MKDLVFTAPASPATRCSSCVQLTPVTYKGHTFHRDYLHTLYEAAKCSSWNITKELPAAVHMDPEHRALLMAFISEAKFTADSVQFSPFMNVDAPFDESQILDAFQTFMAEMPAMLDLVSTIDGIHNTVFLNAPTRVVQHATLDTSTMTLTYTYAELYTAPDTNPTIHKGVFCPSEHLKRMWPHDHNA